MSRADSSTSTPVSVVIPTAGRPHLWLPEKLALQLETARASRYQQPIVSCRFISRSEDGDVVLPRRFPVRGEALSEYLFCQNGLLDARV